MTYFTTDLHEECAPLTKEEKVWVRKVERVLKECPSSRFAFYTVGDPVLTLYDQDVAHKNAIGIEDGGAGKAKIEYTHITSGCPIDGCSG